MPTINLACSSAFWLIIASITSFTTNLNAQSNSEPELKVKDQSATLGNMVQFVVSPTDNDGVVPGVFLESGPNGAQLEDNFDGTRTFNWQANRLGQHDLRFIVTDAQDRTMQVAVTMTITVTELQNTAQYIEQLEIVPRSSQVRPASSLFSIGYNRGDVVKILTALPVSESQINVQQTPIAVADGRVYIANMEIGNSGDGHRLPQKTVLRQGIQGSKGDWQWDATTIDDKTIFNIWHTAPSVGVDKAGHIHVTYNMHNMPWQYKRSVEPHQIDNFDFLGQRISEEERDKVVNDNNIDFPTLGQADIPGNQITYPAFFKDRNEELFVSYRFAATPKRHFSERTMSAGIASYDVETRQWTASGGNIPLNIEDYEPHSDARTNSIAIAGQRDWTAYRPSILFDNSNQMLVHWFWRLGTSGSRVFRPCMVISTDRQTQLQTLEGVSVPAPVTPDVCGNMGYSNEQPFYTIGSAAIDAYGSPYILLSPEGESRQIAHFDQQSKQWVHETAPFGATEIFFDRFNTLWAISTGIKIFKREEGVQNWEKMYDEGMVTNCYPKAQLDETMQTAFIHTQACDSKSVTVYALRLQ